VVASAPGPHRVVLCNICSSLEDCDLSMLTPLSFRRDCSRGRRWGCMVAVPARWVGGQCLVRCIGQYAVRGTSYTHSAAFALADIEALHR